MPHYFRYLLRNIAGPFAVVTAGLAGIIWLTQSLRFIDMIVNRGLSVGTFLTLTVLLLPAMLSFVLPVAAFAASLFAYWKLAHDSELVVLQGAGLSRRQLAAPAVVLAGGVVVLGYVLSLYALPVSYRQFKEFQTFVRHNYASVLLQEEVFTTPVEGLTVFIRERDRDGGLHGILVHDHRKAGKPVTMMAEEGRLVQMESGPRFVLIKGNRQEIDKRTGQLSLLNFDRYALDLAFYMRDNHKRTREPEERYLGELLTGGDASDSPEMRARLLAQAHQRLTWPLYGLGLVLVALVFTLRGPLNRRSQWQRLLAASGCGGAVLLIAVGTQSLAVRYPIALPLLYLNALGVIGAALWYLRERPPTRSHA